MGLKNRALSEMYDMSYSVVYGYKRWKAGGSYAGYNLSNVGRIHSMEGIRK
jgi:transposase